MKEKFVGALVTVFIILVFHRGDRSFVGSAPVGEDPPSSGEFFIIKYNDKLLLYFLITVCDNLFS